MNTLTNYGVYPRLEGGTFSTKTLTEMLHYGQNTVEEAKFFADASELLHALGDVVKSEIIPDLENYQGRWHPSGFMVYQLGDHSELGTLRLHIWPKGIRKRLLKGKGELGEIYDGDIHNHSWYLASLALVYYCDNIYEVTPEPGDNLSQNDIDARELFRIFNVSYGENVQQSLVPSGSYVTAKVSERREAKEGEIHTIVPGVYHSPTIPIDTLGATLVFDSFRVASGPDILVRGTDKPIFDTRRVITFDDGLLVKSQFI